MFIKRAQPVARRTARRSRSSESNEAETAPAPVQKAPRRKQEASSDSEGDAGDIGSALGGKSTANLPKTKLSLDMDQDGEEKVFKVKKTKMSRQMTKERAPVGMPKRGLNSASGGTTRRGYEGDIGDVPDVAAEEADVPATLPNDADIVNITDDADQVIAGGDDADSGSEPDTGAGAAARIARARRAAAREVYGNAANQVEGLLDHQPDYIPMVRPKRTKPMEAAVVGEVKQSASPFEPNIETPVRALVPANMIDPTAIAEGAEDWAIQQMRIGAHRRHGSFPMSMDELPEAGFVHAASRDQVPLPKSQQMKDKFGKFGASTGEKVPNPALAIATLWETMQKLEGSVEDSEKRDTELEGQRQEAIEQLAKMEEQHNGLDKKLQVAQELEEFSWGIGGLIDAKIPKLAQAAKTLAQMEQEFTSKRSQRRIRDFADELCSEGASLTIPLPEEGDDKEAQDVAAAVARRKTRSRRRQQRLAAAKTDVHDGWDTSSMSEEDGAEDLAGDRAAFCGAVHKQLLGDVSEGFSETASVLRSVRKAKQQIPEEYAKAYVPNSLPDVLALYIEHSLLWWDPLQMCPPPHRKDDSENGNSEAAQWGPFKANTSFQFEGFAWFEDLADYTELLGDDDPDAELVPKVMQRCLFPEVFRRISDCWDVTSLRHTERIVALLDECVLFESDESATAYSALLEKSLRRLEDGLARHAPEVFVPNTVLTKWYASAARLRLLWRSCKIARCAMLFDQRLPDEQLSRLLLSSIFATRIAPHLRAPRVDTNELKLIEQFVSLVPERWLESGLPATLVPLRDALGPRAPQGPEAAATAEVAARILARMGCHDEAQVVQAGQR